MNGLRARLYLFTGSKRCELNRSTGRRSAHAVVAALLAHEAAEQPDTVLAVGPEGVIETDSRRRRRGRGNGSGGGTRRIESRVPAALGQLDLPGMTEGKEKRYREQKKVRTDASTMTGTREHGCQHKRAE